MVDLPAPFTPTNAIPVAALDDEIRAAEHVLRAVAFGYILKLGDNPSARLRLGGMKSGSSAHREEFLIRSIFSSFFNARLHLLGLGRRRTETG